MHLAVSNIDWSAGAEAALAETSRARGASGIELDASTPGADDGRKDPAGRNAWRRRGLGIHGFRLDPADRPGDGPEGRLFGDDAGRRALLRELIATIDRAAGLGASTVHFRAPGARRRGGLTPLAARQVAVPFFREVAARSRARGVAFCIEPVAGPEGGDFLAHGHEAAALVEAVGREGLGLALDTGTMLLAGDDAEPLFLRAARYLRHVRLAEPGLAPIGTGGVDPSRIARALRKAGYAGWVSAAMRSTGDDLKDYAAWAGALERLWPHFGGRAAA